MCSNDCIEENTKCKIFCHGHCMVAVRKKNTAKELILKLFWNFACHFADALGYKTMSSITISAWKKIRLMITGTSLSSHTMQGVRLVRPRTWLHTRVESESLPNSRMGVASWVRLRQLHKGVKKKLRERCLIWWKADRDAWGNMRV